MCAYNTPRADPRNRPEALTQRSDHIVTDRFSYGTSCLFLVGSLMRSDMN